MLTSQASERVSVNTSLNLSVLAHPRDYTFICFTMPLWSLVNALFYMRLMRGFFSTFLLLFCATIWMIPVAFVYGRKSIVLTRVAGVEGPFAKNKYKSTGLASTGLANNVHAPFPAAQRFIRRSSPARITSAAPLRAKPPLEQACPRKLHPVEISSSGAHSGGGRLNLMRPHEPRGGPKLVHGPTLVLCTAQQGAAQTRARARQPGPGPAAGIHWTAQRQHRNRLAGAATSAPPCAAAAG